MQPIKKLHMIRMVTVMVGWLVLLGALLTWMIHDSRNDERRIAAKAANAFFQQIVGTRMWNVYHGGVYVPLAEEDTPSNEPFSGPEQTITVANGLKLTKLNPAYMTEQMDEVAERTPGAARIHITSLHPIRPESMPTEWERVWLQSFEQGITEQRDFLENGDTTWFRYMAPLIASQSCLLCHDQGGFKEGDVLGGISISIPYPTSTHATIFWCFFFMAATGLACIYLGAIVYERKRLLFDATFNSTIPTCVTDTEYTILLANESYWKELGRPTGIQKALKCYEHRPGEACHTANCPMERIKAGACNYVCEPSKEKNGLINHYIVRATPILDGNNTVIGIVESFQDITVRKSLEQEKEKLIAELQSSLDRVKVLSGLIPICSSCKKIRDDQGYWSQVEAYISRFSEAKFSHGICPACVRKLYPEFSDEILDLISKPD